MPANASYKTAIKIAVYLLFIAYLVFDLNWGGPLKKTAEKKITHWEQSYNAARRDQAVAKVYGEFITKEELDSKVREELFLSGRTEEFYTPGTFRLLKLSVLNRMIEDALIHLKTKTNDLGRHINQKDVEREWQAFTTRFNSDEELKNALAAQNMDERTLRLILEARLQQEEQINSVIGTPARPTEEEIVTEYDLLKKNHTPSIFRPVSHIFLRTLDKDKSAVQQEAQELLGRVKQGESFAELAQQYSDDANSAPKGGSLGMVGDTRKLPGGLEEKISELPDNTPVLLESTLGYHIMIAGTKVKKELPDLETLRPRLVSTMISQRRNTLVDVYLDELKKVARAREWVIIYHDRV